MSGHNTGRQRNLSLGEFTGSRARPWYFLAGIALAELLIALVHPILGLSVMALLLFGWIPLTLSEPNRHRQSMMLALVIAPVLRLVSLALPLHLLSPIIWYPATAIPLYVAAWKAARTTGLGPKQMGLTSHDILLQLLIGMTGIGVGVVLYQALRPGPLLEGPSAGSYLVAVPLVMVSTGFLDEFIFRGVLQTLAFRAMGWTGPVYIALLYAVMHIGYRSVTGVLAAFGLALLFSVIARRTQSIVGVGLANGLAVVVAYLILPSLTMPHDTLSALVAGALVILTVVMVVATINKVLIMKRKDGLGERS